MVTEEGNVGGTMFVDLSFHEKSMEDVSLLIRIAFTGHEYCKSSSLLALLLKNTVIHIIINIV